MSGTGTRGPRTGRVPPHIHDRLEAKRRRAARLELLGPWYRRNPFVATVAAVVGLVAGVMIGRLTAPDPVAEAAEAVEDLTLRAAAALAQWESGTPSGAPPVTQAVDQLRSGDSALVTRWLDTWLTGYDAAINALDGEDVPVAAAGVRDLLLAALELQRDATATLGAAATVDGAGRDVLLTETERLRARAGGYAADARRLSARLTGGDVADVPSPPPAPELPRPSAPADDQATAPQPADAAAAGSGNQAPSGDASPAATGGAEQPAASPTS